MNLHWYAMLLAIKHDGRRQEVVKRALLKLSGDSTFDNRVALFVLGTMKNVGLVAEFGNQLCLTYAGEQYVAGFERIIDRLHSSI